MRKKWIGFTLVELMVVTVMAGVMATFAISNFSAVLERAQERAAWMDLQLMYGAMKRYRAKNGFYPPTVDVADVAGINASLGLNLVEDRFTYECAQWDGGDTGECGLSSNDYLWGMHIHSAWHDIGCPHCYTSPPCPSLPTYGACGWGT